MEFYLIKEQLERLTKLRHDQQNLIRGNTMTHYAEQMKEYDKKMEELDKKLLQEWEYDPKKCTETIELDLRRDDILKMALVAHEKDITLNHLLNNVIIAAIKDAEYRFEHDTRPQLLNEDN